MAVLIALALFVAALFAAFALGCVVYYFHNRQAADLGHVLSRFLVILPDKEDPGDYQVSFKSIDAGDVPSLVSTDPSLSTAVFRLLVRLLSAYQARGNDMKVYQDKAEDVTRNVVVEFNKFKQRVFNANTQALANAQTIIRVLGE